MADDRQSIAWTQWLLESFRLAYNMAVKCGHDEFDWGGHRWVTGYAKYLIEYLDGQFSKRRKRR